MAKFLRLTEWKKYQHYMYRNPPWLKLHRNILQSQAFMSLSDDSKLLAFVCIVLAGDSNNMIPLDRDFIQARGGLKKRPDVRPLVKSGFAEIFEGSLQVASTLHPNCPSETETETELETELKGKPQSLEIGIDEATQKVFIDLMLAGTEARMLVQDAVKAYVNRHGVSFEIAAHGLIEIYREYEAAEIPYKKGVFKFFKEGLWNPTQIQEWRNGKNRGSDTQSKARAVASNNLAAAAAVGWTTPNHSASKVQGTDPGGDAALAGEIASVQTRRS